MLKKIGYGLVLWVIPYAASIPLLPLRESSPLVFKSVIGLIAALVASVLMVLYFKTIERNFLKESVVTAIIWIAISLILDMVAIMPFAKLSLLEYFMQIGIENIAAAIIIVAVGYLLEKKVR